MEWVAAGVGAVPLRRITAVVTILGGGANNLILVMSQPGEESPRHRQNHELLCA